MSSLIHIIMQARVGSSRLQGKVLKTILAKTILDYDIERCLLVRGADATIIATTYEPEAEKIIAVCRQYPSERLKTYRGSTDDVLARYYHAARENASCWIIRITSDCPLFDPALIDDMIDRFRIIRNANPNVHLLTNNTPKSFPHGLDAEIFTYESLEIAHREARLPFEREHVTPFIKTHPELFDISSFTQPVDESRHRWTLDYPEDFEFIKAVIERLYPANPAFTRHDVMQLVREHPEIAALNSHLERH